MSRRTEYVCDRCGKDAPRGLTLQSGHAWGVVAAHIGLGQSPFYEMGREPPTFESRDLCKACLYELDQWLRTKPEGA